MKLLFNEVAQSIIDIWTFLWFFEPLPFLPELQIQPFALNVCVENIQKPKITLTTQYKIYSPLSIFFFRMLYIDSDPFQNHYQLLNKGICVTDHHRNEHLNTIITSLLLLCNTIYIWIFFFLYFLSLFLSPNIMFTPAHTIIIVLCIKRTMTLCFICALI